MKRTYLIFKNKAIRDKAIDFLVKTNLNFQTNIVKEDNKPCFISFAPKVYRNSYIDLYLSDLFVNSFSTFK